MKKIDIPDLAPMYYQVRDALKELQGNKGYVSTKNWDWVWCYLFDNYPIIEERNIKALKVDDDSVYILDPYINFEEDKEYKEEDWWDIWDDDSIYFIPTLFRIAEAINNQII